MNLDKALEDDDDQEEDLEEEKNEQIEELQSLDDGDKDIKQDFPKTEIQHPDGPLKEPFQIRWHPWTEEKDSFHGPKMQPPTNQADGGTFMESTYDEEADPLLKKEAAASAIASPDGVLLADVLAGMAMARFAVKRGRRQRPGALGSQGFASFL